MARLRAAPPKTVGGILVQRVDDFAHGVGDYPRSDILRFDLGDGGRVIVRPSGTEPKLKCYLDAWSQVGSAAERQEAAAAAVDRLEAGMRDLLG